MENQSTSILVLSLLFSITGLFAQTNWTPDNGSFISGDHINIDSFTIPSGYTVYVLPYGSGGYVSINAKFINIAGTLSAIGAGYGGGGGGGGGGGADSGGPGSAGSGGAGTQGGVSGGAGVTPGDGYGGRGGDGGAGAGIAAGAAGAHGTRGENSSTQAGPGGAGQNGGYLIVGGNGDPNSDDKVFIGSGGGGGGGGGGGHSTGVNVGGGGGGGGGAGGRGGGSVLLFASYSATVTGTIDLSGTLGGNGHAGADGSANGGNGGAGGAAATAASSLGGAHGARAYDSFVQAYSGPGGDGGPGGSGAGGGLLIRAPVVSVTGTVRSVGGNLSAANGGSFKIRYGPGGLNAPATPPVGAHFYNQTLNSGLGSPIFSSASPTGVAIANADPLVPNQTIHYTLDGSAPTTASPLYTGPITLSPGVVLRAASFAPGFNPSGVAAISIPVNDSFANRLAITGSQDSEDTLSIAATKEFLEPNHAGFSGGHSLWWEWTAPFSSTATISVDIADYDTILAVYTGTDLAHLTPIAANDDRAPGNTASLVSFQAVAGAKYEIALDAKNAGGAATLTFRQYPPLAITNLSNLTVNCNPDGTLIMGASVSVGNFGTAMSGPLRLEFVAVPTNGNPSIQQTLGTVPLSPSTLSPGQMVSVLLPSVVLAQPSNPSGIGTWLFYCVLEEQFGDLWPVQDAWTGDYFSCVFRSCGASGCIIVDDGPVNLQSGVPSGQWTPVSLTNVFIRVPTNKCPEGASIQFSGTALFGNGTHQDFTNTAWTNFPAIGLISTNGLLQLGAVSQNTALTVTAPFTYQGTPGAVSTNITILNLPPPLIKNASLQSGHTLRFTLQGVPNRRHALQASGNLLQWSNLNTCVLDTNGAFSFTDTNVPVARKFYRALELP